MPRDERTYITVHDGMPEHPKVEGLSDGAFRTLMDLWCWCSRNRTDGAVTAAVWAKRAKPAARRELLGAGLVEETESGVQMHDYLEHQRSSVEIDELSAKRREAAAASNHQRWHVGRGKHDPTCPLCLATSSQPVSQVRSQTGRRTVADTESENRSTPTPPTSSGPPTATDDPPTPRPTSTTTRGTRLPDDFPVTEPMRTWAAEHAPGAGARDHEQFCDYWRAKPGKDGRKTDWVATWRNWMRRASDDRTPTGTGGRARTSRPMPAEELAATLELGARLQAEYDAQQPDTTPLHAIGGTE